jgi:hypothetical protein
MLRIIRQHVIPNTLTPTSKFDQSLKWSVSVYDAKNKSGPCKSNVIGESPTFTDWARNIPCNRLHPILSLYLSIYLLFHLHKKNVGFGWFLLFNVFSTYGFAMWNEDFIMHFVHCWIPYWFYWTLTQVQKLVPLIQYN